MPRAGSVELGLLKRILEMNKSSRGLSSADTTAPSIRLPRDPIFSPLANEPQLNPNPHYHGNNL